MSISKDLRVRLRIAFVAVTLSLSVGCSLKDIRPESYQRAPTAQEMKDGRKLLDDMGVALGTATFRSQAAYRAKVSDDWSLATFPFSLAKPWDVDPQVMEIVQPTGSKDFRVMFLNGADKGNGWGASGDTDFRIVGDEVSASDDDGQRFPLSAMGYLTQLPHIIGDATFVFALGRGTIGSKTYDKVLASWGTGDPQEEFDQYILWIDVDTKRLAYAEFTIRAFNASVNTAVSFENWFESGGAWFAKTLTFRDGVGGEPVNHRMTITALETGVELEGFLARTSASPAIDFVPLAADEPAAAASQPASQL